LFAKVSNFFSSASPAGDNLLELAFGFTFTGETDCSGINEDSIIC